MQDHSVRPTYYRLAPGYRRSAMYMLAGLLLIGAVSFWTARFKPKQGVPGIVSGYVVFAGFTVAMALPLRWALRVDDRGVARRRVFGWDLWEWSDFASGRIRKQYPHTLVDPDRPWWRRRLRFEYMLAADTKQVLNLINAHYRLPPPPELPETLEIKYAFRRSATFDWRGIYLFVRGRPHEYLWNDIRRVHITRTDPLHRDFKRLEIYLPDQEIDLKVLITQGGPSPTWRGATPEVIDEFLRQYVPSDLNRAVAQATGETITTIRELGFGLADPEVVRHDPEPPNRLQRGLETR